MRLLMRVAGAWLLVALVMLPALGIRPAAAAPARATFNDCGYQSEMSSLAVATSKLFSALWKMQTAVFHQQQAQLLGQLGKIDARYGSSSYKEAHAADAALRASLLAAADAVDGRDAGVNAIWTAKMKTAYAYLNGVWAPLKTFCALGHTVSTEIDVSLTGGEYASGVAPMPVAPPWLSVSKKWAIHWSYACYGVPNGFRIEVRAVRSRVSMVFTGSGLYLGPILSVPVARSGGRGSGTSTLNGVSGPVYLIVRTRCLSSVKVVG